MVKRPISCAFRGKFSYFLLSHFFYTNGVETVIFVASLYGKNYLGHSLKEILMVLLLIQFFSAPDAYFGAGFQTG